MYDSYPIPEDRLQIPPQDRIETINGIRMYYEIHGQGDCLLLLHGFNVSGVIWRAFIQDFSRTYRLIIPDLRGHGNTDNPPDRFSHRLVAPDLRAIPSGGLGEDLDGAGRDLINALTPNP